MEVTAPSTSDREELVARVGWAIFILSYLTQKRSHADLPAYNANEGDEDEEHDGHGDLDAETEKAVVLQGPRDSIRSKFLDCVAQLLSPSKGWDGVCATALCEHEDYVDLTVARNDGFKISSCGSVDQQLCKFRDLETEYCKELTKYLSYQQSSSTEFELLAISYASNRVDDWVQRLRDHVTSQKVNDQSEYHRLLSNEKWATLIELLHREDITANGLRERIVQQAYECVAAKEVYDMLHLAFEPETISKLWYGLRFVARPMLDCRMLRSIASEYPQFRDTRISPLPSSPSISICLEWQIDICEAWTQLTSTRLSQSKEAVLSKFSGQFKRDLAASYSLHAEMQLFMHQEDNPHLAPTRSYFGCSKKACLLCATFLQALPDPIATRARHGICYPAWAVPRSRSAKGKTALRSMEKELVSRIKTFLDRPAQVRKAYFSPPVPQSTLVSDFSMLTIQEQLQSKTRAISAKELESLQTESRLALEGATLSPESFQEDFAPRDSCVMCNTKSARQCDQCYSVWYCSSPCRKSDLSSHKLLCKRLATQVPRPSENHRRAIFFPVDDAQPQMIWLPISIESDEGVPYHSIDEHPYLGKDRPAEGTIRIEHNPIRGRNLGSGMAIWSPQREGYSVAVIHRDAFLKDGSAMNKSILSSMGMSGSPPHSWRGPMVALRTTQFQFYEDITLADFRHIIDYLKSYSTTETRESATQPENCLSTNIRGVKICCSGEEVLHGSEPFVSVDVPKGHPTRLPHSPSDVSPISKILGMPLTLWKDPDIQPWIDPPGWEQGMTADSNPNAAFLMMETNLEKRDWGWAPPYWNNELGNVLAVRVDGKDLNMKDLSIMCYFARYKLQPMFEDALGGGLIQRTKEEVLDFITWENMMACELEMVNENLD